MIVYREQRLQANPRRFLAQLCADLQACTSRGPPSHDEVIDALIATGMLESGIADALFLQADGLDPIVSDVSRASLALGHALWHSWRGDAVRLRWPTSAGPP